MLPFPDSAPLPFMPAAVREFLLTDPTYQELCPTTTTRDLPQQLNGVCGVIRSVDPFMTGRENTGLILRYIAYAPMARAFTGVGDPEEAAWNAAARVYQDVSHSAKNVPFRSCYWTGTPLNKPVFDIDKTRGPEFALYSAMVRLKLTIGASR